MHTLHLINKGLQLGECGIYPQRQFTIYAPSHKNEKPAGERVLGCISENFSGGSPI